MKNTNHIRKTILLLQHSRNPLLIVGLAKHKLVPKLLKQDLIAQAIIHTIAVILGIIMYLKYRVVEDHEYHRSNAIKRLSSMYRLEEKGLWSRGDSALEKLEESVLSLIRCRWIARKWLM